MLAARARVSASRPRVRPRLSANAESYLRPAEAAVAGRVDEEEEEEEGGQTRCTHTFFFFFFHLRRTKKTAPHISTSHTGALRRMNIHLQL